MFLCFVKKERGRQKKWCHCHRLLNWVVCLFVFLFCLPIIFLFIYRWNFISPVSTLMMRDALLGNSYQREWVALSDISSAVPSGIIMSEDNNFCSHHGVDWDVLWKILNDDVKPWRGGSTVTMQMVKNLFLWPSRSYVRKGLEIIYSLIADFILPKKRIMEIYINIVEWGPRIYGVEAASLHYFSRHARDLTIPQVAAFVASLPNPHLRNPYQTTDHFLTLSRIIEQRIIFSKTYTYCLN
ncbi:biosynthetic peptidoglycan transglycosylase [Bartonella ancashensis]|uniref:Biosynthetic peptidoglycan transglycosylase n=1 Tax=Bartonella ancashensis TaxID=1318743 RepID=A0A0M4M568_9HYPH|nr:transglycosylase domain-containing protein [Bartonella ancashensis]ALE03154.1 Monofunctional biosynthetic peptidoglycan transglycosylase [Bartonella ancashensis]